MMMIMMINNYDDDNYDDDDDNDDEYDDDNDGDDDDDNDDDEYDDNDDNDDHDDDDGRCSGGMPSTSCSSSSWVSPLSTSASTPASRSPGCTPCAGPDLFAPSSLSTFLKVNIVTIKDH